LVLVGEGLGDEDFGGDEDDGGGLCVGDELPLGDELGVGPADGSGLPFPWCTEWVRPAEWETLVWRNV
jgi:hypothetical protein